MASAIVVIVLGACQREQYHLAATLNLGQVKVAIAIYRVGNFSPRGHNRLRRFLSATRHE